LPKAIKYNGRKKREKMCGSMIKSFSQTNII
jgi:hypothetical protein